MPTSNYRVKKCFSIIAHSPNEVELRSGVWNPVSYSVEDDSKGGKLFRMISMLDGSNSTKDLAAELDVSRAEVEALVDHLLNLGVIETGPINAYDAYMEILSPMLRESDSEIEPKRRVILVGSGSLVGALENCLSTCLDPGQIQTVEEKSVRYRALADGGDDWLYNELLLQEKIAEFDDWRGAFLVLCLDCIDPDLSSRFNRVAYELRIPWMHVALDGPFLLVGPTITRDWSCYDCFETRIAMNMRVHDGYARYKNALASRNVAKHGEMPMTGILCGILAGHSALEVMNFVLCESTYTMGKVLTIYIPTMEISYNEILKNPECPTCGALSQRDDQQLYFDAQCLLGREDLEHETKD